MVLNSLCSHNHKDSELLVLPCYLGEIMGLSHQVWLDYPLKCLWPHVLRINGQLRDLPLAHLYPGMTASPVTGSLCDGAEATWEAKIYSLMRHNMGLPFFSCASNTGSLKSSLNMTSLESPQQSIMKNARIHKMTLIKSWPIANSIK